MAQKKVLDTQQYLFLQSPSLFCCKTVINVPRIKTAMHKSDRQKKSCDTHFNYASVPCIILLQSIKRGLELSWAHGLLVLFGSTPSPQHSTLCLS
jgi:hypothetical protein